MAKLTLQEFMTKAPHTIGDDQTLETARATMRKHRVRHLPVLRGGELVGLLSERDVLFLEAIPGIKLSRVLVEEAMSSPVVAHTPATSLEWVAAEMSAQKLGSVVIVDRGKVVGVFTTVDALRALQTLLARGRRRGRRNGAATCSPGTES